MLGSNGTNCSIEETNCATECIVLDRQDQDTMPEAKDAIETRRVDSMVPSLEPEFANLRNVGDGEGEETTTKVKNGIQTRKIDLIVPPFKLQVVNVGEVDAVNNKRKNSIVTNDASKALTSRSPLTHQKASLVYDARSEIEDEKSVVHFIEKSTGESLAPINGVPNNHIIIDSVGNPICNDGETTETDISSIDDEEKLQKTRKLHMPTLKAIEEWLKSDAVANMTLECEEVVGLASRIHRSTVYQMRDRVRDSMTMDPNDGSTNTEYDLLYNQFYQRELFL